ncbi:MAG: hypothetical protein R3E86_21770 [Pseudomonadales bacterium]
MSAPLPPDPDPAEPLSEVHSSRLQLIWDVVVFQFKLGFDGLRDLLLVPAAIVTAIMGLVAGGEEPDRYFKQLLRFGRRSELWINLFGHRHHRGTSDELMQGLRERVFTEAQDNPWLHKAGTHVNKHLDEMNARVAGKRGTREPTEPKSDSED